MDIKNKGNLFRLFIALIVMLCCICVLGFSLAERTGKTEVAAPYGFGVDANGQAVDKQIMYFGGKPLDDTAVELTDGNKTEPVQDVKITFVSGPEETKDALSRVWYGDTCGLMFNAGKISQPGEATYHIYLESEHFFTEFDTTFVFKPVSEAVVDVTGTVWSVPTGQHIYSRDLLKAGIISDELNSIKSCYLYAMNGMTEGSTNEYEVSKKSLTIKKDGEYQFLLAIRFHGADVNVLVTLQADSSIKEMAVSGNPCRASAGGLQEEEAEPESGESLLADAFGSAEDFEDSTEDGDTSVLESMTSKEEETPVEDNNQELTQEDKKNLAMGLLKEKLDNNELSEDTLDLAPLLDAETKMERDFVFEIPVPVGFEKVDGKLELPADLSNGEYIRSYKYFNDGTGQFSASSFVGIYDTKDYSDDPDLIRSNFALFGEQLKGNKAVIFEKEITLDGSYPAYVLCTRDFIFNSDMQMQDSYVLSVVYMRGVNSVLKLQYTMNSKPYTFFSDETKPTIDAFMPLLSGIHYVVPEERAGLPDWLLTPDDFAFDLECKSSILVHAEGGTNQFSVKYRREDLGDVVQKLPEPVWQLADFEAYQKGEYKEVDPSIATINDKGLLKVGKVPEPKGIVVFCTLRGIGISSSRAILVAPKVGKVTLSETTAVLYVGESDPLKLSASVDPEGSGEFGPEGVVNMVWASDKPDIVAVKDMEDGTAIVEALAPGKAKVTVKDVLSGKQAVVNITVLVPVTGLEIQCPETVAAGKNATCKVVLTPAKPGNNKVQWSIDVDESIASINAKNGALKVKKDVPAGTKITVTCTAEGAAVPKVATKVITVE